MLIKLRNFYQFLKTNNFKKCLFLQFYNLIILKYYFTLLVVIFLFSCDKKQEQTIIEEDTTKPLLSVVVEHSSIKKVSPFFKKDVEDWKELNAVENFLNRFKKVSPNEVLLNAIELKGLATSLKDSIKPGLFETPAFNTRINIFYNEVLRLADMTKIPAIKADEVNKQMDKTLHAFSAINAKVNTVLSKKRFEDAITIDVKYIGLDSTKIDTMSRNSINKKLKDLKDKNVPLKKID